LGDNTDVKGFSFLLDQVIEPDFVPEIALVIGSGGAGRAALQVLAERYPEMRMEVASRHPEIAQLGLGSLEAGFASFSTIDLETAAHFLHDFPLVIQATPVGSVKLPGCPVPEPLRFMSGGVVLDLIYAPYNTRFLEYAEQSGARIQNGLPMLLAQAAESFQIWTGKEFPLEQAMHELLPQLSAA
jgi:shikimate dehydrogenase